jgi:hypothetical protein
MRSRSLSLAAAVSLALVACSSSGTSTSTPSGPTEYDKLFAEAGGTPTDPQALDGLWVVSVGGNDVRLRADGTNLRFGMKCGSVVFGVTAAYSVKSKEPMPGSKRTGFRGDLTVPQTQTAKGAGGEYTCELSVPAGAVGYTVQDGKLYLTGVGASATKAPAASSGSTAGGDNGGVASIPEFTKIGD